MKQRIFFLLFMVTTTFVYASNDVAYVAGKDAIESILERKKWLREKVDEMVKKERALRGDKILLEKEADELKKILGASDCNVWVECIKKVQELREAEIDLESKKLYMQASYGNLRAAFIISCFCITASCVVLGYWFLGIKKERDIYFGISKQ